MAPRRSRPRSRTSNTALWALLAGTVAVMAALIALFIAVRAAPSTQVAETQPLAHSRI